MEAKDNVVHLFEKYDSQFPVGTEAWHPKYHWCRVIEVMGMNRKIRSVSLDSEKIEPITIITSVRDLKKLPHADVNT